jgi:hypothetical protein
MSYGELVKERLKEKIKDEITYFSATMDIWSSRAMESFVATMMHVL